MPVSLEDSIMALKILFKYEMKGLPEIQQIELLTMSCANIIIHSLYAITNNKEDSIKGLAGLHQDMLNNLNNLWEEK